MLEDRQLLRRLLKALVAERSDADGLYIPRGEDGMRRMIRSLLAMRPAGKENAELERMIEAFMQSEVQQAQRGKPRRP